MRFGFYSPYLDTYGGGERYMLTLASHFSLNHDVDIFWNDSSIKPSLAKFLKIDLGSIKFVNNIFSEKFLKKSVGTKKYDVIFIISDGSIPFSLATKNILHFQVPFKFQKTNLLTKLKLKQYRYVVCNSYFTKQFVDQSYKVNSEVVYPPIDLKSLIKEKKQKIILSVGRFSQNQLHPKKQEILVEVFKEIHRKLPGWRLVLIGQAKKEDQRYLRKLKRIAQGQAIKILENLPFEKLRKYYGEAFIYWHATGFGEDELKNPERMEHFGMSTVEAAAAGAIPIVINRGGQKEIIEDKKNGLLWDTKTQLLDNTMSVINSQGLAKSLSRAAIQNSKRFSQDVFFREYEKIFL